jgi:predicted nicotinamide N-methyase
MGFPLEVSMDVTTGSGDTNIFIFSDIVMPEEEAEDVLRFLDTGAGGKVIVVVGTSLLDL